MREHCSSAQRVYSVFITVEEVSLLWHAQGGRVSVSGARRLPKCDTFADRRVCFCRLWFTLNVAVVVIIPTAVNIFRARAIVFFPPSLCGRARGPEPTRVVARAIGHRGKPGTKEGLAYDDDLRDCGGSPGGRNVPC